MCYYVFLKRKKKDSWRISNQKAFYVNLIGLGGNSAEWKQTKLGVKMHWD